MLVIAVVALVVFGPERLPELARKAGEVVAKFRSETARSVAELKRAADIEDLDRELRGIGEDVRGIRDGFVKSLSGAGMDSARGTRAPNAPPPTDPDAT